MPTSPSRCVRRLNLGLSRLVLILCAFLPLLWLATRATASDFPWPPPAPTNLTATMGNAQVTLNWNHSGGATGFYVKRATVSGGPYTQVATVTGSNYTYTDTGLTNGTTYYYVVSAYNVNGQSANSNQASATPSSTPVPGAPAAPTVSNVTHNSLTATLPALPANTTSLILEKMEAPYGSWQTVATGQLAGAVVPVTALKPDKVYSFRCIAVGPSGSTAGAVAQARTLPPIPGAPSFSSVTPESVTVTAPDSMRDPMNFGAPTYTLTLQRKLTGAQDSTYVDIASNLPIAVSSDNVIWFTYRAVTDVYPLLRATSYTFRYVAVGSSGNSNGTPAAMTTSPQITWSAGGAIACGGIRWPQLGSNPTLPAGAKGRLSAFLATDWDAYQIVASGVPAENRTYSDPCSYTWNVSGGTFENGINSGQSAVWIAPTTPGTYTIQLMVDDQNTGNKPPADSGSRDDASRGYNDQPLKFQITVAVQ